MMHLASSCLGTKMSPSSILYNWPFYISGKRALGRFCCRVNPQLFLFTHVSLAQGWVALDIRTRAPSADLITHHPIKCSPTSSLIILLPPPPPSHVHLLRLHLLLPTFSLVLVLTGKTQCRVDVSEAAQWNADFGETRVVFQQELVRACLGCRHQPWSMPAPKRTAILAVGATARTVTCPTADLTAASIALSELSNPGSTRAGHANGGGALNFAAGLRLAMVRPCGLGASR